MPKSKKPRKSKQARRPIDPAELIQTEPEDEELVVPEGVSKAQGLFIIGLMIFTLIIFTVGDSLTNSVSRDERSSQAELSWASPAGDSQELSSQETQTQMRELSNFFRGLGQRRTNIEEEEIARLAILDGEAKKAGIEVSDGAVGRAIIEAFQGDASRYHTQMEALGLSKPRFEATFAKMLRIERLVAMRTATAAVAQVKPKDVLKDWKENNQEYAYEYIEVPVENFTEAAKAELVSDEELDTWYQENPRRSSLFREEFEPERFSAELVGYAVNSADANSAAALLERYPAPTDVEPEELGRQYFDSVRTRRFKRPEKKDDEDLTTDQLYFKFEEVQEQAVLEAPIQSALVSWWGDLQAKANTPADAEGDTDDAGDNEIDLKAEAEALGLTYYAPGEARSHSDWTEDENLGGVFLAGALRSAGFTPNMMTSNVVADEPGLFVARITEKIEGGLPEMAKIRDRVVEEWAKEKAADFAKKSLADLRVQVETPEEGAPEDEEGELTADLLNADPDFVPAACDAARFAELAQAVDSTVKTRSWLSGWGTTTQQFQGQSFDMPVPPTDTTPEKDESGNQFITSDRSLEALESDGISSPLVDREGKYAYLVRSLGSRDPEDVRMPRADFEQLITQAQQKAQVELREEMFGVEALKEKYGLYSASAEYERELEEEEAAKAAEAAGDSAEDSPGA